MSSQALDALAVVGAATCAAFLGLVVWVIVDAWIHPSVTLYCDLCRTFRVQHFRNTRFRFHRMTKVHRLALERLGANSDDQ